MDRELPKLKLVVWVLGMALLGSTIAAAAEPDVELNYYFLKLGLTRKVVVEMLGPPTLETVSRTIGVPQHRLTWATPDGQKFAVFFIARRAWRWKRCSAGVVDC